LLADREPGVANEANEIVLTGDQSDDLFLTKTNFAETVLNLGTRAKLFDAHRHASPNSAERTKFTPRLLGSDSTCGNLLADVHVLSLAAASFPNYTHFAICWACFGRLHPVIQRNRVSIVGWSPYFRWQLTIGSHLPHSINPKRPVSKRNQPTVETVGWF
jgi:hypothetical protein